MKLTGERLKLGRFPQQSEERYWRDKGLEGAGKWGTFVVTRDMGKYKEGYGTVGV